MSADDARSAREASIWFARLRTREISAETLAAFARWRAEPAHDQAFAELERVWRAGETLTESAALQDVLRETLHRSPPRRPVRWMRPAMLAGATGVLAAIAVCALFLAPRGAPSDGLVYATPIGRSQRVRLADGSTLSLDADSRAVLKVQASKREAWLTRGQAFFDVVHDRTRPFHVHAGRADIVDLGTRFDVELTGDAARVALVAGGVQIARGGLRPANWTLKAGEQVDASDPHARPGAIDADVPGAWLERRLVFRETPLRDVLSQVNRYTPTPLRLNDEKALGGLRVSGGFEAGDTRGVLEALQDLYGLYAVRRGPSLVLFRR